MSGHRPTSLIVQREQLRQLYAGLPFSIFSTVLLVALVGFVLQPVVEQARLLGWMAGTAVLCCVRLVQWAHHRRAGHLRPPDAALAAFRTTTTLAGILWGTLTLACYPPDWTHQVFLAFVVAGVTAGAMIALAPDRRTSLSFLACSITPLAVQLLRAPDPTSILMGVMVSLFLAFTMLSARRAHQQFVDNIELRAQADDARTNLATALADVSLARAQLEAFVAHAPAAVAMFDANLRYLAHSRRWVADYRLEGTALIGRSFRDFLPESSLDWPAIHRRCLQGGIERSEESPIPRADGSVQWVHWEVRPWRNEAGDIGGLVMLSEDITERRAAGAALRASNERLRKLSDLIPGVIYQYCQRPSGRREFVFVSAGARDMLGIEPGQLLGNTALLFKAVHSEDKPAALAHFTMRPGQDARRSCDYRIVLPSGEQRWIRDESTAEPQGDGTILCYGHMMDITDRPASSVRSATAPS